MSQNKGAVYCCGGMEGYTKEQMTGWRTQAKEFLEARNIKVYDPTRRIETHAGFEQENIRNRTVKLDLQDIANSTVLLCDMRASQPGKRWGSMSEIAHAHTKNKIIIIWTDPDDFKHPFLYFYATEIHHTLEDCLEAVEEYFK